VKVARISAKSPDRDGARQQLFEADVKFVKNRLRRDEAAASEQLA